MFVGAKENNVSAHWVQLLFDGPLQLLHEGSHMLHFIDTWSKYNPFSHIIDWFVMFKGKHFMAVESKWNRVELQAVQLFADPEHWVQLDEQFMQFPSISMNWLDIVQLEVQKVWISMLGFY